MRIPVKLVFSAFLALLVLGVSWPTSQRAEANPNSAPTIIGSASVTVGTTVIVQAIYTQTSPGQPAYLRSTTAATGTFITGSGIFVSGVLNGEAIGYPGTVNCPNAPALPCVNVTAGTGSTNILTINVSFTCNLVGNTTFILSHNGVESGSSTTLSCTSVINPGGGGVGAGQIAISATPNALICGGTSTLTASARDSVTGIDDPHVYHFQTDIGQILQQSDTKAILALLPGQLSATVTATTIAIPLNPALDQQVPPQPIPVVLTATIVIQNFCADQIPTSNSQTYAIALVATPNIIPCGGTANLTATARDASGQIVPGVGFTFQTDAGGLIIGPPNSATSTAGTATLTLQPGQGKTDNDYDALDAKGGVRVATVTASIGSKYATVRIQQYCPGVTSDGSSTPGKIVLIPSSSSVNCLGNSFIGAVVKDSKGQVPPNDTEVTFISTSGFFTSASGATGAATSTTTGASATPTSGDNSTPGTTTITTTTGQYIAKTTKNGALNVIFNAGPSSNGQVMITAAAGASFGTTTIVVNCPTAIVTGFGGGSAAGGLGLLGGIGGALRPPNTGEGGQIRPPNTGDAGLAESGTGSNNTVIAVTLSIMAGALTSALALRQRRS